MKKTAAGFLLRYKQLLSKHGVLLLLFAILIIGLLSGLETLALLNSSTVAILTELLEVSVNAQGQAVWVLILRQWGLLLLWLLPLFLFGLCVCGIPFIPLFLLVRGFGYAVVAGYYSAAGKLDISVILQLFPGAFLEILLLLFASEQAIRMSAIVFRGCFGHSSSEWIRKNILRYWFCYLQLAIWSLVGSAASVLLQYFGSAGTGL